MNERVRRLLVGRTWLGLGGGVLLGGALWLLASIAISLAPGETALILVVFGASGVVAVFLAMAAAGFLPSWIAAVPAVFRTMEYTVSGCDDAAFCPPPPDSDVILYRAAILALAVAAAGYLLGLGIARVRGPVELDVFGKPSE